MDPDYVLFARVVETGSLSAAGRATHTSPAAVSKRLARLEARLGVRLLHRTTRRLALTAPGERLYADLVAIISALREAESRVTGARSEPAGPLRVSAPTSFARLHLVPTLHHFLAQYPRIELDLDLTDAYVDLFDGRTDVAIRIASDIPASVDAHRISGNRRILCANPAYLERHGTPQSIAALSGHRLLAADGQLPWRLVNGRQKQTVDGRSHVRTNSSEVIRELAATGVGIALRSLWDVGDALASGALVPILQGWEGPDNLAIYAVHLRTPVTTPNVTVFIDHVRRSMGSADWE